MSRYSDLEITFRKRDERLYALGFRFHSAEDAAEQRSKTEPVIAVDFAALAGDDPAAYAETLSAAFFTPEVRGEFGKYRAAAATQGSILRVRLSIDANAAELHGVHWETLRDPDVAGAPLFAGEQTIVSRFLISGEDWRPIRLRARGALRALLVVANPTSGEKYGLAPVDVAGETARATEALAGIQLTVLAPGRGVSLGDLAAKLREDFDILYLVCHGRLVEHEPWLFLEDGPPVAGAELVQAIRELDQRPRMVVLASCQSAGKGEVGLAALGPRLAEAGVPAVIAMQGNIFMATAAAFMKRFFKELLVDGQIDRAMAVARGEVRKADDAWMPVLFLRLRDGRVWYEPGFGGSRENEFDKWRSICTSVRAGHFIPIVGPELGDDLFGGTRELARVLAEQHGFPLDSHDRSDLAKVAQFIRVEQKRSYVCDAVQGQFLEQVRRRLSNGTSAAPQTLASLLDAAVERSRADAGHPYRVLSELPASIYLNASYEPMLLRALRAARKDPEPVFTTWRGDDVPRRPEPKTAKPTPEQPWVYHVFGMFGKPDSLVLTEDDFFDYLIAEARLDLLLPALVGQLMQSSLLFLGFQLDDWRFRALFRMIVTRQGTRTLRDLSHVGVQVNPSEWSVTDANKARRYIESYFHGGGDAPEISIYWGSPRDFLTQLREHLAQTGDEQAVTVTQGAGDEWF
jgi:Arc/MetJ family transcription regulator